MKASSINISGPTSFLLKGPYGYGKTLAAASFAIDGPVYIAYWDKKKPVELVTFFKKFGERGQRILDNIEYDVYGSSNANEYLNKVIDFTSNCKFTAFVTDSLTTLTSSVVNWSQGFNAKGVKQKIQTENPQQLIPGFDEYKSETAMVAQALDLCRTLPCHIIWTAHPLPSTKIEGSGGSMKVSKSNSLVTYGSKVAGIVPGQFTEIYHFSQSTDYNVTPSRIKYVVNTEAIGDEFAKSALGLPKELDITNQLFYDVWLKALNSNKESINELTTPIPETNQPTEKKWNSTKGVFE